MAIRKILTIPDIILREKSLPVEKVNKEIKNMNKLNSQLSKELYRLKDMFDVIPIPDSNGQKFVWDIKKPNDHLKVVDIKKKGKKNDKGNNNKNNH